MASPVPARAGLGEQLMLAEVAGAVIGTPAGEKIRAGRFVVLEAIGHGGMGAVYLAHDPELDRRVAIKVLRRGDDSKAATRLQREAVALARLQHPNVVAVHEVGTAEDEVFVAMEYVEGVDLRTWMVKHPPAGPKRRRKALSLLVQAGRGLAAAHDAGIVHRDFKPGNVLVGDDGRVRVADFGLARSGGADDVSTVQEDTGELDPRLTATGTVMGTPLYLPPELQVAEPADIRSDQFSFCVSAWHVLFGKPPWNRMPDPDVPPEPPEDAPAWLVAVLLRGMHGDPAKRYASMAELVAALSVDPRRRRRRLLIGAGVLAAGGVAGGLYAYHRATLCDDGATALNAAWGSEARAAVETALRRADVDEGADAWARTSAQLDRLTTAWTHAFAEVCDAGRRRRAISPTELRRAMGCLQTRRVELEAATDLLRSGEVTPVWHAAQIGFAIESPAACADTDKLGAALVLPAEPEAEEAVLAVHRQLFTAQLLGVIEGKWDAAERTLDAIAEQIEAMEHVGLQLRAQEIRIGAANAAHADDRAAALGEEGYWTALSAGDDGWAAKFARRVAFDKQEREELDAASTMVRTAYVLADRARVGDAERSEIVRVDGVVLMRRGQFVEAAETTEEALALAEAAWGADHPRIASTLSSVTNVYLRQADWETALEYADRGIAIQEKAFGADSVAYASSLTGTLLPLDQLGRKEEAVANARRIVEIFEARLPPGHRKLASAYSGYAVVAQDPNEQLDGYRRAAAVLAQHDGPEAASVVDLEGQVGRVLLELGRYKEAETVLRRTSERLAAMLGPDHERTGVALALLMHTHIGLGKLDEAEAEQERALAIGVAAHGEQSRWTDDLRMARVRLLLLRGRADEALAEVEGVHARAKERGETDKLDVSARVLLPVALAEVGRRVEAEAAFAKVLDGRPGTRIAAEGAAWRSLNLSALGRRAEARAVARDGLDELGDRLPHRAALLHYALAEALRNDDIEAARRHLEEASRRVTDADWRERVDALRKGLR